MTIIGINWKWCFSFERRKDRQGVRWGYPIRWGYPTATTTETMCFSSNIKPMHFVDMGRVGMGRLSNGPSLQWAEIAAHDNLRYSRYPCPGIQRGT